MSGTYIALSVSVANIYFRSTQSFHTNEKYPFLSLRQSVESLPACLVDLAYFYKFFAAHEL